jgi:hypothetical protein
MSSERQLEQTGVDRADGVGRRRSTFWAESGFEWKGLRSEGCAISFPVVSRAVIPNLTPGLNLSECFFFARCAVDCVDIHRAAAAVVTPLRAPRRQPLSKPNT